MTAIDVNSDVGESFGRWELGDDAEVLIANDVGIEAFV